jgi:hypothetical protein
VTWRWPVTFFFFFFFCFFLFCLGPEHNPRPTAYLGLLYLPRFSFPPFIVRRAPRQMMRETSSTERWNYGREMTDQFSLTMATSTSL